MNIQKGIFADTFLLPCFERKHAPKAAALFDKGLLFHLAFGGLFLNLCLSFTTHPSGQASFHLHIGSIHADAFCETDLL